MSQLQTQLEWEKQSLDRFNLMITKIPLFHREIAKKVVQKKAQLNAQERGASLVEECDIIRAFFSEVPHAFYSLMIRVLDEVGFRYHEYKPK